MNQREQQIFSSILYYAALGVAAWFILRYFVVWFLPFLLGAGVSALLRPIVLKFCKKYGWKESLAGILFTLLFYVLIVGSLSLLLVLIGLQGYDMLLSVPKWYGDLAPQIQEKTALLTDLLGRFLPDADAADTVNWITQTFQDSLLGVSTFLIGKLGSIAAGFPKYLFAFLFTITISFLTSAGYASITKFLGEILPASAVSLLQHGRKFLQEVLFQYLKAYITIMAVTFIELSIGLWLLKIPYGLSVAALISVVDILPVLGCGTVLIPWAVISLVSGETMRGLGLLLLYCFILLVRTVMEPKIVGSKIGLHPVATMTAMYAGLQIGGLGGMLTAPLIVLAILRLTPVSDSKTDR